jgi:hypothetical protein
MKVTSKALHSHLPEANQAFKQGQKVQNIGQKSAKESESENISQNWVNQHFSLSPETDGSIREVSFRRDGKSTILSLYTE